MLAAASFVAARFPTPLPADYAADPVCTRYHGDARGTACTSTRALVIGSIVEHGRYRNLSTTVALPGGRRIVVASPHEDSVPAGLRADAAPRPASIITYRGKVVGIATAGAIVETFDTPETANGPATVAQIVAFGDILLCAAYFVCYAVARLFRRA